MAIRYTGTTYAEGNADAAARYADTEMTVVRVTPERIVDLVAPPRPGVHFSGSGVKVTSTSPRAIVTWPSITITRAETRRSTA